MRVSCCVLRQVFNHRTLLLDATRKTQHVPMNRIVEPELLDELPPEDPRAARSRRDLKRINAWMGNAKIMASALQKLFPQNPPRQIVEIGAGDGRFLLNVLPKTDTFGVPPSGGPMQLSEKPPEGRTPNRLSRSALLIDRQNLLADRTRAEFEKFDWNVRAVSADVFEFFRNYSEKADAIIANLFLHHFSNEQLLDLLRAVSRSSKIFIAVEPRRAGLPLFFSRLLWLIGCNSVTRHDAVVSVRAGFADRELSALWPDQQYWNVSERAAGLFSHVFVAQRKD
jgi:hypothetical protein